MSIGAAEVMATGESNDEVKLLFKAYSAPLSIDIDQVVVVDLKYLFTTLCGTFVATC